MNNECYISITAGNGLTYTAVAQEIVIDAAYVNGPLRIENGYLEETEPGVWTIHEGERPGS